MQNATEEEIKVSGEAVRYLAVKMEEFGSNLVRNSMPLLKQQGMRTLMQRHIEQTLNSLSLVLKNIPKIEKGEKEHKD